MSKSVRARSTTSYFGCVASWEDSACSKSCAGSASACSSVEPERYQGASMLIRHIALVPELDEVPVSEVAQVSAALQTQVMRDLWPIWGICASVDVFASLEDVPIGYWPILITPQR